MEIRRCKQFSVYLENRVGALAELCRLISDRSINLLAVCAIDTVEEAVLRIVAEDEAGTLDALRRAGFRVVETDVFLVERDNVPGRNQYRLYLRLGPPGGPQSLPCPADPPDG